MAMLATLRLASFTTPMRFAARHARTAHLPRRGLSRLLSTRRNTTGFTLPHQRRSLATLDSQERPIRYLHGEPGTADIYAFLHRNTETWQYIVADPETKEAVVIDSALDYDAPSGRLDTKAADELLEFAASQGLSVVRILETHAHADHLTASQYLKSKLPREVPICIGRRIRQVQTNFAPFYGFDKSLLQRSFDVFFEDDEKFDIGNLSCSVMHLPGHTPDHIGYLVGKAVFTGDSIFMPDVGSARVDFPGGDAHQLYSSMHRLLSLPEDYLLFVGHDYPSDREYAAAATVATHRAQNKHVKVGISEKAFTDMRQTRDKSLGAPRLFHPSLQVNVRAGRLPPADEDGNIRMKIPLRTSFRTD
ncbi:Metallo-hydrolase/oxidoreductase [Cylindrobasidium torrendii FP15055 ss-10]|uniref:Metallo-hydrolase/oxidoreductase n=1 Tax=Cylindrobasidium torrendii FP15055 ss-10 TaxID=1314674 RepID=A0A0D7AU67_9AGAR|nr:Metallo-hydrolase/oxidoreductase [Cylindrobasidium torrendii FP15055 ss-10]